MKKPNKLRCLIRFVLALAILPVTLPFALFLWCCAVAFVIVMWVLDDPDEYQFFTDDPFGPFTYVLSPITTLGGYRK